MAALYEIKITLEVFLPSTVNYKGDHKKDDFFIKMMTTDCSFLVIVHFADVIPGYISLTP